MNDPSPPAAWPALSRRERAMLVTIVTGGALLRLPGLGRFPEVVADEGLWTTGTKNFLLFGDWFMDGGHHFVLSPLFHALSLVAFLVAGPGIASARAVSAVAGVVSIALVFDVVRRLGRHVTEALLAAALFACAQSAVWMARHALIESVELACLLATAACLLRPGLAMRAAAGAAAGLALLAKINAAPVLLAFALWYVVVLVRERASVRRAIAELALFGGTALVVAGGVYGALYRLYPVEFVSAYRFELDGRHFQPYAHPVLRVGRFGIDPLMIGRTILALLHDSPFLSVLGMIGGVMAIQSRPRGTLLPLLWGGGVLAFFLAQLYQPTRYFYLALPALLQLAAFAIASLGAQAVVRDDVRAPRTRRLGTAALVGALVIGFELAYDAMAAVANPAVKVPAVSAWARANLGPRDRVMAAGYLATDIPGRAYSHYRIATDSATLGDSLRARAIDYFIYDRDEVSPAIHAALEARYRRVAVLPFGAIYSTSAPLAASR